MHNLRVLRSPGHYCYIHNFIRFSNLEVEYLPDWGFSILYKLLVAQSLAGGAFVSYIHIWCIIESLLCSI